MSGWVGKRMGKWQNGWMIRWMEESRMNGIKGRWKRKIIVQMDGWIDGQMDGWVGGWMDKWMKKWKDG